MSSMIRVGTLARTARPRATVLALDAPVNVAHGDRVQLGDPPYCEIRRLVPVLGGPPANPMFAVEGTARAYLELAEPLEGHWPEGTSIRVLVAGPVG